MTLTGRIPTPKLSPWERAARWILKAEGGYANVPGDRGGETNYGLTWPAVLEAIQRGVLPRGTTVRDLTAEQALLVYRACYYGDARCMDMPPAVGLAVFDAAVHSGIGRSVRWLQDTLNDLGACLVVDGQAGFQTVAALQAQPQGAVLDALLERRREFLRELAKKPKQAQFSNGWQKRVNDLEAECRQAMES